jgi:hypothetical protein
MTSALDIQTSSPHSDVAQVAEPSSGRLVHADRPDEAVTELGLSEAIAVAVALQQRGDSSVAGV